MKFFVLILLIVLGCAVEVPNTDVSETSAGVCYPDCNGRECGREPICNSLCGVCSRGKVCNANRCVKLCIPDCLGRRCGPDPICGLSCGTCSSGYYCDTETATCKVR